MPDIGMHPGATWRKADFQIHTPRDPQWQGSPHLAGGPEEFENARKTWATEFVAECVRRGLGAIGITDHHDFCFIAYVQEAIAALADPTIRFKYAVIYLAGPFASQADADAHFESIGKPDDWEVIVLNGASGKAKSA